MIYAVLAGLVAGAWWLLWGRLKIDPDVKALGDHLVHCPQEWVRYQHTIDHVGKKVSLWYCNGWISVQLWPAGISTYNLKEKRFLYECICKCINRRVVLLIGIPKKVKV